MLWTVSSADEVTAVFADGSTASGDVLIGADGVHSTVRRLIDPSAPGPRYTGMLAFEGRSDASVPDDPGTMTFAFGRKAYYLYWSLPGDGTTWGDWASIGGCSLTKELRMSRRISGFKPIEMSASGTPSPVPAT